MCCSLIILTYKMSWLFVSGSSKMKNHEKPVSQDQLVVPKKESVEIPKKKNELEPISPQINTKISATTSSEDEDKSHLEDTLRGQHFAG